MSSASENRTLRGPRRSGQAGLPAIEAQLGVGTVALHGLAETTFAVAVAVGSATPGVGRTLRGMAASMSTAT